MTPSVGDFSPRGSNWPTSITNWDYFNGNSWTQATFLPSATDNVIIRSTITSPFYIDSTVNMKSINVTGLAENQTIRIAADITVELFTVSDDSMGTIEDGGSSVTLSAQTISFNSAKACSFSSTLTVISSNFTVGDASDVSFQGDVTVNTNLTVTGKMSLFGKLNTSGAIYVLAPGNLNANIGGGSVFSPTTFSNFQGTAYVSVSSSAITSAITIGTCLLTEGDTTFEGGGGGFTISTFTGSGGTVNISSTKEESITVTTEFHVSNSAVVNISWVGMMAIECDMRIASAATVSVASGSDEKGLSATFNNAVMLSDVGSLKLTMTKVGTVNFMNAINASSGSSVNITINNCNLFCHGDVVMDKSESVFSALTAVFEGKISTIGTVDTAKIAIAGDDLELRGSITNEGAISCSPKSNTTNYNLKILSATVTNSSKMSFSGLTGTQPVSAIQVQTDSFTNTGEFSVSLPDDGTTGSFSANIGTTADFTGTFSLTGGTDIDFIVGTALTVTGGSFSINSPSASKISISVSNGLLTGKFYVTGSDTTEITIFSATLEIADEFTVTGGGTVAITTGTMTVNAGVTSSIKSTASTAIEVIFSRFYGNGIFTITGGDNSHIDVTPGGDVNIGEMGALAINGGTMVNLILGNANISSTGEVTINSPQATEINFASAAAGFNKVFSVTAGTATNIILTITNGITIYGGEFTVTGGGSVAINVTGGTTSWDNNGEITINSSDSTSIALSNSGKIRNAGSFTVTGGATTGVTVSTGGFEQSGTGTAIGFYIYNAITVDFEVTTNTGFFNGCSFTIESSDATAISFSSAGNIAASAGSVVLSGGDNTAFTVNGAILSIGTSAYFEIIGGNSVVIELTSTLQDSGFFAVDSPNATIVEVKVPNSDIRTIGEFNITCNSGDIQISTNVISLDGTNASFDVTGGSSVIISCDTDFGNEGTFTINSPNATSINLSVSAGALRSSNAFTITGGTAAIVVSAADILLDNAANSTPVFNISGGSTVEIHANNGEFNSSNEVSVNSPDATQITIDATAGMLFFANQTFAVVGGNNTAINVSSLGGMVQNFATFSVSGGNIVEIDAGAFQIENNRTFSVNSPAATEITVSATGGIVNSGAFSIIAADATNVAISAENGINVSEETSTFTLEKGGNVIVTSNSITNAGTMNFSSANFLSLASSLHNSGEFKITDAAASTDYDLQFTDVTNLNTVEITNTSAASSAKHNLLVENFVNGSATDTTKQASFVAKAVKSADIYSFKNHDSTVELQNSETVNMGKMENYGKVMMNNVTTVLFNDPVTNSESAINGKDIGDLERQRELYVIDLTESGIDFSLGCVNYGLIIAKGCTGLSFGADVIHFGTFQFKGDEPLASFGGQRDIATDSIVEYSDTIGSTNLPFGDDYGSGTVAFIDKASGETTQVIKAGCILINNINATADLCLRGENIFRGTSSASQSLALQGSGSPWIRLNAASDYIVDHQIGDPPDGFEGIFLESTYSGTETFDVSARNIITENLVLHGDAMNYNFTIADNGGLTNLAADCRTVKVMHRNNTTLQVKSITAFETTIAGITATGNEDEEAIKLECKTSAGNPTPLKLEGNLACDGQVKVEASTVECVGDFSSSGHQQTYKAEKISGTATLTFDNKTSSEVTEFDCPEIISVGAQNYTCNLAFRKNVLLETTGANITVTGTVDADSHNISLSANIAAGLIEFQDDITSLGDGKTVALDLPAGITGKATFRGDISGVNGLSFGEGTDVSLNGAISLVGGGVDNNLAGSVTFDGDDRMSMTVTRNLTFGDPIPSSAKAKIKLDINSRNASGLPHTIQIDGTDDAELLIGGNVEVTSSIMAQTDNQPIEFRSSGLTRLYQGVTVDFSDASEFHIEGRRGSQIAGEITVTKLIVSEAGDTAIGTNFIDGTTTISAQDSIEFQGNLTVAAGDGVAVTMTSASTDSKALSVGDNLLVLSGVVDISACNTHVAKDLVVLKGEAATMNNDGTAASATESGVSQLFAYNTSKRNGKTAAPGLSSFPNETFFGDLIDQTEFFATFTLGTVEVEGNFYSNGVDLSGGTLKLHNTDSLMERFAEAYNGTISNLTVELAAGVTATDAHAFLSTDKCTDGGGCTNVAFDLVSFAANKADVETNTFGSGTYSISDHVLRVELTDGTNPIKIENSNNEIADAIKSLRLNGGKIAFVGAYTDIKCTTPTDGAGDLNCVYLKVNEDQHAWKTDATGDSAGDAESTTRSGKTPATEIVLDVQIEKATSSLFHTLRGYNKNRIKNYSADIGSFTQTEDRCGPVMVKVRTGQEMHTEVPAGQNPSDVQKTYDGHNFIEIRYSEPMQISALDENAVNHKATDTVDETTPGGAITEVAGGGLTIEGFFSCTGGSLKTGSRGGAEEDPTVHSVYRVFSVDGTAEAPQKTGVRIGIAAYAEENPVTINTFNCYDWKGYIDSATLPTGKVTVVENIYIRDCSDAFSTTDPNGTTLTGNALDISGSDKVTVNNAAAAGTVYGAWDISPPTMAKLLYRNGDTFDWDNGDAITFGETVAISTVDEFVDKFECHFFDNTPNFTQNPDYMGEYKWVTGVGWVNTALPQDGVVPSPENRGGARPFNDTLAKATPTLGGIRISSVPDSMAAFKFADVKLGTPPDIVMGDTFNQEAPSTKLFINQTNPGVVSDVDGLYLSLGLPAAELGRYPAKTTFILNYTGDSGYITDLAGNRMRDFEVTTYDRSSPGFLISMAPIGQNKMYIQFNRKMSTAYLASDGTNYDLLREFPKEIIVVDGRLQSENTWDPDNPQGVVTDFIDTSVPARLVIENDLYSAFEITLKEEITLEAVLNYYIRVKKPTDKRIDPFSGVANYIPLIMDSRGNTMEFYHEDAEVAAEHTISDVALGLVDVLYAYDNNVVKDGSLGEGIGALRIFDGTGQLATGTDFYIQTMLNNGKQDKTDLTGKLSMFMSISPTPGSVSVNFNNSTGLKRKAWLPEKLEALAPEANTNVREFQVFEEEGEDMRKFKIPNESDKTLRWKGGSVPQFMFKYKNPETEPTDAIQLKLFRPHVFALPLENPADLTSIGIWSFKLTDILRQRGGVSIFNNVVNPLQGQHATIEILPPRAGTVTIFVMGIDGGIVKYIHQGNVKAGGASFTWDGTNNAGLPVARGLYFIRVVGPDIDETRKVMIVK